MKFPTKKIKLFFLKIKWFFNPYRFFARRKKLNELSAELKLQIIFITNARQKLVDHDKQLASIKSNASAFKKTIGEKNKDSLKDMVILHETLSKLESKFDKHSKSVDESIKRIDLSIKRFADVKTEIDGLDGKQKRLLAATTKANRRADDLIMEMEKISEQFKEAMAIQGRSAVYELQGKKNEFIRDFELFLARRDGYGRERENNQTNFKG